MTPEATHDVIAALIAVHGTRHAADIERGVTACARVWESKGGFGLFCREQYVPPGAGRTALLARLDEFHHAVEGGLTRTLKTARAGQDMADRPTLAAEAVLAAFSPANHLEEDYRSGQIAALAQLNFATDDRTPPRTRPGWAARRLGDIGRTRVPARLRAQHTAAATRAEAFVSSYNLNLDKFDFGDPRVRFPKGTSLISHWGLRDTMTNLNGTRDALPRQRAILDLMRRVVDGAIPAEVLDQPKVRWSLPDGTLERDGTTTPAKPHGALRWQKFREVWKAQLAIDPHTLHGNLIEETFERDREMSEAKVVGILTELLESPVKHRVGRFVAAKLGRQLEPFDIYYGSFQSDGAGKSDLGFDLAKRYPDAGALQAAIPGILTKLGWKRQRAAFVASKIRVDRARSAGHAWPPHTDDDRQLLRVRFGPKGCDEIGFGVFMHELGHSVEGVLSSYEMDYKILWSVPNTAFTEGFAFTFQDRADEILGRRRAPNRDAQTLHRFWQPFEIAGAALTEIRFFHWLYAHKNASAEQMQRTIRRIADEVWAEYFASVFGKDGHGLLAVYSHILLGDFYLADYPMGFVIAYQVRKYLEGKSLPEEMERMCALGSIYPESWMTAAVGSPVSVRPLLDDTAAALDRLGY